MYRVFETNSSEDALTRSYSATYKMVGDDVVIESCNECYKSIYQLSRNFAGKSLAEISGKPSYANSIKEMMLHNDSSTMRFVREQGGCFWCITIKVRFPYCDFFGEMLNDGEVCNGILVPRDKINLNETPSASIMLRRENDAIFIESFCDNAVKFFGISANCVFKEEMWKTFSFYNSLAVLHECLNLNKSVRIIDEIWSENGHKYLLITLVPVIHGPEEKLLLIIRFLEQAEYYSILKKSVTFFTPDIYPTHCAVWYDYEHRRMQDSNQNFNDVFFGGRENYLDDVFSSTIMQNAIVGECLSFGKLNIPKRSGESEYYFCCAMPIPNRKTILLLMTSEGQNNGSLLKVSKKLTKREGEILDYIVLGNKTTYIAKVLGVKEGTVKKIISNMYKKLDVSSRVELIRLIYFFEEGKKSSE